MIYLNDVDSNDNDELKKSSAKSDGENKHIPTQEIITTLSLHEFFEEVSDKLIKNDSAVLNKRYTIEGNVSRVTPYKSDYYCDLIDDNNPYQSLTIRICNCDNINVKEEFLERRIQVTGKTTISRSQAKIQLKVDNIKDIKYDCSRKLECKDLDGKWKDHIKTEEERSENVKNFTKYSRVAVLSSENSAGYTDFKSKLAPAVIKNVHFEFFDWNIDPVADTIRNINKNNDYDCIAIVRGGGSKKELHKFFSNDDILKAISESKIPVVTGIGHTTDRDLICRKIAFYSADTPTDLARNFFNTTYFAEWNERKKQKAIKQSETITSLQERNNELENLIEEKDAKIELLERENNELKLKLENVQKSNTGFFGKIFGLFTK